MKKNNIKFFLVDESGAESVEWVIVCAGIVAVTVVIYSSAGLAGLQDAIEGVMVRINNSLK